MKYASFLIVPGIIFLSCSDGPSRQDALTTGTWILSGYLFDINNDGVYEEDAYASLETCIKDNIYTFLSDGNLIVDEGPSVCNTADPHTVTSSWSFSDDQTHLQFEGEDYEIEELGASTLRLRSIVFNHGIFPMKIEKTFTKQ